MRPLTAAEITGVWATPLLNVDAAGRPRPDGLSEQIDYFASVGVDGVYSHGTAAEFHGQSEADFRKVCSIVADRAAAADLPFQIGATHPFARETLNRIRFARSLAPSAIQIILPDWVPVDLRVARRFLQGCIEAADGIGLVLYHPPHAKRVFAPADLVTLLDNQPGMVGLKCAGGDADWYASMQPLLAQLSVFIPGHFMASGMAAGARGSYSNVCCLNPAATVRWRDQIRTDPAGALELERRICRFMNQAIAPFISGGYPGYACDKFLARIGGWTDLSTDLVWPYLGIPETCLSEVRAVAQDLLPEFFDASAG